MNDLQAMLHGSVASFHDAKEPATAKSAAYLVGSNGLSYLLPSDEGKAVIISALHLDIDQVTVQPPECS